MTEATIVRLDELRTQLADAQSSLELLRLELGTAVADGDEAQAVVLREDLARLEARAGELAAAVLVAEERAATERAREEQERTVAERERLAQLRDQRIEAARKVDRALKALGKAWRNYAGIETTTQSINRRPVVARTAFFHWAEELGNVLGVQRTKRPWWKPFAESEEETR